MISEPFAFGDSPVHRIDPRVRVLGGAMFAFVTALSDKFPVLGAAFILACLAAFAARLGFAPVARRLALINGLVLFLWVILPLTYNGTPAFRLGPFQVAREGLELCAIITVKSNAIVIASMALFSTMPVAVLGHALNRLRLPEKLVALLLLTCRYIFVLETELSQLTRAVKIRSFRPKTNLHTYRTYAYLVGMLLVRAAERGERVHKAMICRGFSGRFYCLDKMEFTKTDAAWAAAMASAIIALGVFQWAPAVI